MKVNTRAKVCRFIDANGLIKLGDKVIAALSGGADSVALLYILDSLKEEYKIDVYAAHFNHRIRGAEADRDEAFVTDLCERLQITLYRGSADVPAISAETGESLELCGRRLRYDFLQKQAGLLGGAKIATAHHSGDNAETMLWNLTRGTGIGGLCGIPVKRDNIIRPLLCCTRAEIEGYCRDNNIAYVTDSTNLSDDYTRNRLRHQVMPVLRGLNPDAEESMRRTASLMREVEEYFDYISEKELNKAKNDYGWSCARLLSAKPILQKYAVKKVLENAGAPVDFRHITLIIEAMHDRGAVDLGQGFSAECAQGTLRIISDRAGNDGFCVPLKEYIKTHGVRVHIGGGKADLTGVPEKYKEKINSLLLKYGISCDIITPDTVVRSRRAGDTFTDARRGVTKSLKKLLNELKIPREDRDSLRVVANGSTVLWLEDCGTSAQAEADLTRDGDIILLLGEE